MLVSKQMTKENGLSERTYKYQFDLELYRLEASFPRECRLQIMWKRGPNSISTQNPIIVNPSISEIPINEKLSFVSACTMNQGYFVPKASQIALMINQSNIPKKIAKYNLQLTTILNPNKQNTNNFKQFQVELEHCVLKAGIKLYFKLSSKFLGQGLISKEMKHSNDLQVNGGFMKALNDHCQMKVSNGSANVMQTTKGSSGMTNPLNPPNSSNTLTASMTSDFHMSNFFEKKDLMSVASLASSTHRKGSSLNKNVGRREYGLMSSTKGDFDQKQRNVDNRTENGDTSYQSKQLIEEQNKRSRLEAEINKNKLYIQQLKKKLNQILGENSRISKENNFFIAENNSIKCQKDKIWEENNVMRREIQEIKCRKVQQNNQNQEQYKIEIFKLKNQINLLMNENSLIKKQLQNKKQQQKQMQYQFNEQKKKFNQKLIYSTKTLNENNIRYIEEQKQSEKYKNQVQINMLNIINLNEEIKKIKDENQKNCQNMYKQKNEQQKIKQQLTRFYFQEQRYKDEITKLKQQISNYIQMCKKNQQQIGRLKQQKSKNQKQINNQFAQQCLQKQNLLRTKQEKILSVQKQLIVLNKQLYKNRQQQKKLQQQLIQIRQKQSLTRHQLISQKQQNMNIRDQLTKYKNESTQQRQQNIQLRQQNTFLRQQMSSLRQDAPKQKRIKQQQLDRILRESLQLQVQLKYSQQQLTKLSSIRTQHEQLQWKLSLQMRNRSQLQQNFQRVQKQLNVKTRQLLIQGEKIKMLTERLNQAHATIGQMQQSFAFPQLNSNEQQRQQTAKQMEEKTILIEQMKRTIQQRNKQIYRLTRQIDDAQQYTIECKEKNDMLINKCDEEIENRRMQSVQYVQTISQKTRLIDQLRQDISSFQRDIRTYQEETNGLKLEIQQYRAEIDNYNQKMNSSSSLNQMSQNQVLKTKIEMIMEEMHGMKKKYEENKPVVKSQDVARIKQIENQLDRRDKIISKLSKEKLELDEQNVKMTVQIMKLIGEVDKYKKNSK